MHAWSFEAPMSLRMLGVACMQAPLVLNPPPAGLHARSAIAASRGNPAEHGGSGAQPVPAAAGGRALPRQGALPL